MSDGSLVEKLKKITQEKKITRKLVHDRGKETQMATIEEE
jgi:glutamate synthase domain-containing protein 2